MPEDLPARARLAPTGTFLATDADEEVGQDVEHALVSTDPVSDLFAVMKMMVGDNLTEEVSKTAP